jgi:hypothetical protein
LRLDEKGPCLFLERCVRYCLLLVDMLSENYLWVW